jgi:SAM-dependent methyltransferase
VSLFWEIHSGLPREGPGEDAATENVICLLPGRAYFEVLDAGCGPGAQTLCLAGKLPGTITAVDLHQPFLDDLGQRAKSAGLDQRIVTLKADMESLPFADGTFDLIWSEGAIYSIGFERGLALWRRLLRARGVIVVSELTWLQEQPPVEIATFWGKNYPAMADVDVNIQRIARSGYQVLTTYTLPSAAWWQNHYGPLSRRIEVLSAKYKRDENAVAFLNAQRDEIDMFERFSDAYGYVFYIMERTN